MAVLPCSALLCSADCHAACCAEAIVVGYSRDHNDKVRKNTATNLSTGFVGEGVCASTEPGGYSAIIGLQKYCNANSNVSTNLYTRKITGEDD